MIESLIYKAARYVGAAARGLWDGARRPAAPKLTPAEAAEKIRADNEARARELDKL